MNAQAAKLELPVAYGRLTAQVTAACPYYARVVPKHPVENLRFRKAMRDAGAADPRMAAFLMEVCRRDILFFTNTFVWTYDPRRKACPMIPFNTWPFQDEGLVKLRDALGVRNVLIEKSRDMGASWMNLLVQFHAFVFEPMQAFLLVSRKEELVDKAGDHKSLFWKILKMHELLPSWMRPEIERKKLHVLNTENGSMFDGEATTGDVARGDRRTNILLDEFASVENAIDVLAAVYDASDSIFFNSTPKGAAHPFYEIAINPEVEKLRLHWTQHPNKAAGLYTTGADGSLCTIDHSYTFPADYKFILDGKPRSPWYDAECRRRQHKVLIAQELDIDYLGSAYGFFDGDMLERLTHTTCIQPMVEGDVMIDPEHGSLVEFKPWAGGHLKLWCKLGPDPSNAHNYVIGADISAGTGASNSTLEIFSARTGEQIGEYVNSKVTPQHLAEIAVALARWFRGSDGMGARLAWEANGPGRLFGRRVIELGYLNVYFRQADNKLSRKITDEPGWYSTAETKQRLFGEFSKGVADGKCILRSRDLVNEMREIVYHPTGKIIHQRADSSIDPSGARENHGDRPTGAAVAWLIVYEAVKQVNNPDYEEPPPVGSMAWRRAEDRKRQSEQIGRFNRRAV